MTFDELERRILGFNGNELGEGATEDEIGEAEAKLTLRITGSYRDFLRRFGWGGVVHFDIYGLGRGAPPYLHLVTVTQSERTEMRPRLPHHLLPLMNDGGGNLYCLDLSRADAEPPVVYWNHEQTETQEPDVVAADFVTWMMAQLAAA